MHKHDHRSVTRYLSILAGLVTALTGLPRPAEADPSRMWGSYWGGTGNDHTQDVAFAGSLEVVAVGRTSSSGIAEPDVHDSTLGGTQDAYVAMFEPWGDLVWGTYFGGLGTDVFISVVVDDDDATHAFGTTNSIGFISTVGAHKTTLSGAQDAMLVKFDAAGERDWGTYFGGNGIDTGKGICRGPNGDLYVVGETTSTTGLAFNALHDSTRNGPQDGFIAKFDAGGMLQWATYYGGASGETTAASCAVSANDFLLVVGETTADTDIADSGHDDDYGGMIDAFVAKFDALGDRQWATYYGGAAWDFAAGIAVDELGNVYVSGGTESPTAIATFGPAIQGDSEDGFVVKFKPGGLRLWGRYFGGAGGEALLDAEVHGSQLYLAGVTSSAGLATPDAFDTSASVQSDYIFVTMSPAGLVTHATYNGGTGDEQDGSGLAVADGNAVIGGGTTSPNGIATSGAHDTVYSGGFDAFVTFIRVFAT
jgi:hypothetical protein